MRNFLNPILPKKRGRKVVRSARNYLTKTQTFETLEVNGKIYFERFSFGEQVFARIVPRIRREASPYRLPLPSRPQGDCRKQTLGQHRPSVAGRRPLQMASHAQQRRGGKILHGRRVRQGKIPEIRRGNALHAPQPHVPLVPLGACPLLRNRRHSPFGRHRRGSLEQGERSSPFGARRARVHGAKQRRGGLHDRRHRLRPFLPQKIGGRRLPRQGAPDFPPRQGVRNRGARGVHKIPRRARKSVGRGN